MLKSGSYLWRLIGWSWVSSHVQRRAEGIKIYLQWSLIFFCYLVSRFIEGFVFYSFLFRQHPVVFLLTILLLSFADRDNCYLLMKVPERDNTNTQHMCQMMAGNSSWKKSASDIDSFRKCLLALWPRLSLRKVEGVVHIHKNTTSRSW